jgi:hypothetical protein
MISGPAIDELRQSGSLSPADGKAALTYEHEHQVAFTGEVHDVLGHERTILFSGRGRDVGIVGCSKPDLGDVNGIVTVAIPEQLRGLRREHLVDQEPQVSSA